MRTRCVAIMLLGIAGPLLQACSGFTVATRGVKVRGFGSRTSCVGQGAAGQAVRYRSRCVRGLAMQLDERQKTKMRLREEAESPFRKVRIFLFTSFAASGAVGLFIATTRLVALSQGIDQGQTFSELTTNIAIDISAIFGFLYLVRNDINAQKGRLARMEIGAKLAGLKVRLQLEDDPSTITLAALRRDRGRDKRVAVLAGGLEAVRSSLDSALPYAAALRNSDILIVPLVLEDPTSGGDQGNESPGAEVRTRARLRAVGGENDIVSAVGQAHVALPVALNRWQEYIDTEVDTAFEQGIDPLGDGFSLVLKKNGRIGARSKGCPPWGTLVGDVEKRKAAGMDTTNI